MTNVSILINGDAAVETPHNPHAKEVFQLAEIFHLKFSCQLPLDIGDVSSVLPHDEKVIHPDGDVQEFLDVKTGVGIGSNKTEFDEEGVYFLIPNAGSLL